MACSCISLQSYSWTNARMSATLWPNGKSRCEPSVAKHWERTQYVNSVLVRSMLLWAAVFLGFHGKCRPPSCSWEAWSSLDVWDLQVLTWICTWTPRKRSDCWVSHCKFPYFLCPVLFRGEIPSSLAVFGQGEALAVWRATLFVSFDFKMPKSAFCIVYNRIVIVIKTGTCSDLNALQCYM